MRFLGALVTLGLAAAVRETEGVAPRPAGEMKRSVDQHTNYRGVSSSAAPPLLPAGSRSRRHSPQPGSADEGDGRLAAQGDIAARGVSRGEDTPPRKMDQDSNYSPDFAGRPSSSLSSSRRRTKGRGSEQHVSRLPGGDEHSSYTGKYALAEDFASDPSELPEQELPEQDGDGDGFDDVGTPNAHIMKIEKDAPVYGLYRRNRSEEEKPGLDYVD